MFVHYLELGFRHLRRNPVLTSLMVLTLAVGVAASIATLTILRAMSADPIPGKSDRLVTPLVDLRPDDGNGTAGDEPPYQLSYRDTVALHAAKRGARQTGLYGIAPAVDAGRPELPPFFGQGVAVHTDFFPMFDVPFVRGGAWTADDDTRAARVVVLRESVADRVYGDVDPIGRPLRLGAQDFTVVGVVADAWEPLPRFYRLIGNQPFSKPEDLYLPFATAIASQMEQNGQRSCFSDTGDGFAGLLASECVWMSLWVELGSAGDLPAYRDFVGQYVAEQRKLGRFPRADNHRVYAVPTWLDKNQVVPSDTRLQTYLAFGFLLVCLVNMIGLMLAKFTARAGEIGVRRALGARRREVFQQHLIEAGVVGVVGGAVGVVITFGLLALLAKQSEQIALVARMDWIMLAATVSLAIAASLLAGFLPTWRAARVQPALQLKTR
jgi:putative ABC transport system permease protein